MKIKPNFEIVNVADDYILVPLGDQMEKFNGTVVLNDVSAFILEHLKSDIKKDDLVRLIMDEYDVKLETAKKDIDTTLEKMKQIGIIDE